MTIECVCPTCGKRQIISGDDTENWIKVHSRVLGITVHFKSQFVYNVAMYEREHWLEHRKEQLRLEKDQGHVNVSLEDKSDDMPNQINDRAF